MPLYEEKLINPLAVRFSQDRIWPDFQDGTRIEDSLTQIVTVPLKGASYDLVLRPPFPPMEVIRLKQERREADGEQVRDEKGRRQYGEESWFTFDNRRLYCLQRSALQLWPMVVAVVVKVLFDFPDVRCARHKFRTTSDGCSVKISLPDGQPGSLWNWQEAARAARTTREGAASVLDAVRKDTKKTCKEQLLEPPPQALLSPGTREKSVAERFNLGAFGATDNKSKGQVAGQTLLNMLHGAPQDEGGGGGGGGQATLAALFAGQAATDAAAAPVADNGWHEDGWQEESWQEESWQNGGWQDDGWQNGGWQASGNGKTGHGGSGKGWSKGGGAGGGKGKGRGGKNGGGGADSKGKGERRRRPKGGGG
mmetsp:Transcript_70014/g.154864  ORF Transcript_70014/g.154864 Transcript_70014/m.154864 type:complete len:366 (-) Transcript_70014:117-1214(-)